MCVYEECVAGGLKDGNRDRWMDGEEGEGDGDEDARGVMEG